jgi:hypothetical protein
MEHYQLQMEWSMLPKERLTFWGRCEPQYWLGEWIAAQRRNCFQLKKVPQEVEKLPVLFWIRFYRMFELYCWEGKWAWAFFRFCYHWLFDWLNWERRKEMWSVVMYEWLQFLENTDWAFCWGVRDDGPWGME